MAIYVTKGTRVLINALDLTDHVTGVSVDTSNDAVDATTMTNSTRVYASGLKDAKFNITGYDDYAATSIDEYLNLVNGNTNDVIISILPTGDDAGKLGYSGQFDTVKYEKGMSIGEMAKFTIDAQNSGECLVRVTSLEGRRAISGAGNGTGLQVGAVTATQKAYSSLHVYPGTFTSLVVTVGHATTQGGAYTTKITHTTTSSATGFSELKNYAGSSGAVTDTWWRVAWTLGSGNATFSVFFGIV
jgi:hypothetical protein